MANYQIQVAGYTFELTDDYSSDGNRVKHYVSVHRDGSLGPLALHKREFGDRNAWWLWSDGVAVEAGGYLTSEGALASGLIALTNKRNRLTDILDGWSK